MEIFDYLGSVVQDNGKLVDNVASRIKCNRAKWREMKICVLYDKNVPLKVK